MFSCSLVATYNYSVNLTTFNSTALTNAIVLMFSTTTLKSIDIRTNFTINQTLPVGDPYLELYSEVISNKSMIYNSK